MPKPSLPYEGLSTAVMTRKQWLQRVACLAGVGLLGGVAGCADDDDDAGDDNGDTGTTATTGSETGAPTTNGTGTTSADTTVPTTGDGDTAATGAADTGTTGDGDTGTTGTTASTADGTTGAVCAAVEAEVGARSEGPPHEHTLMVPAADVEAGVEATYMVSMAAGHTHEVTVTAAMFEMLAMGETVDVDTTEDATLHTHPVTLMCS